MWALYERATSRTPGTSYEALKQSLNLCYILHPSDLLHTLTRRIASIISARGKRNVSPNLYDYFMYFSELGGPPGP